MMILDETMKVMVNDFRAVIASAKPEQLDILNQMRAIVDERINELQEEVEDGNGQENNSEESTDNQDSNEEIGEPVSE